MRRAAIPFVTLRVLEGAAAQFVWRSQRGLPDGRRPYTSCFSLVTCTTGTHAALPDRVQARGPAKLRFWENALSAFGSPILLPWTGSALLGVDFIGSINRGRF